jgi:hypothetical protein
MAAIVQHLDSDGVSVVTGLTLPDATAGTHQAPKQLGFKSVSDRVLNSIQAVVQAVPSNDGSTEVVTALDTTVLSSPWTFAAALGAGGAGGVWGATGTYGFEITSLSAIGESGPSSEITVTVDDTTKKVTLTWTQTPGATGYKIYRTATPGTYGASVLRTTIGSGATVTFLDDGSATSTGTPPLVNTTNLWFRSAVLSGAGAGGVWSPTGVWYWRIAAYDSTGAFIGGSQEISVNVDVSTKKVTLTWVAFPNATTYKVYRTQSSGVYTSPAFVATITSPTVTYDDTGIALTAGTLPSQVTYNVPPTTFTAGSSPLAFGNIAIGQEGFYWLNRIVTSGTPEVGNPRQAVVQIAETS